MSDELSNHRFTVQLEDAIRAANLEVIGTLLPEISVEAVLPVAVMAAKMRARYLSEGFKLRKSLGDDGMPSAEQIARLREFRSAYEEAQSVVRALEHAIERGYVPIKGSE